MLFRSLDDEKMEITEDEESKQTNDNKGKGKRLHTGSPTNILEKLNTPLAKKGRQYGKTTDNSQKSVKDMWIANSINKNPPPLPLPPPIIPTPPPFINEENGKGEKNNE